MRLIVFALGVLIVLAACATTPSAPLLTDAERCGRFGGHWSNGACRSQ
jgi:hypothetical protein